MFLVINCEILPKVVAREGSHLFFLVINLVFRKKRCIFAPEK